MADIAKFLRKLRIESEENLGDIAERLFAVYELPEKQRLDLARLVAESKKKFEVVLADIQRENLPEYVDTTVLFAHDLAQMNRTQLAEAKDLLQRTKTETMPM